MLDTISFHIEEKSEKREIEIWDRTPKLAVKHKTGQLGTEKDVGNRSHRAAPPCAMPAAHTKSWALCGGHSEPAMPAGRCCEGAVPHPRRT